MIKKVWQVFGPPLQLHKMQEIDDNMKRKVDYLHSLVLSHLARHIFQILDHKQKKGALVTLVVRK